MHFGGKILEWIKSYLVEQNVAAIDHFSISRDIVSLEDLTEEEKTSFKTSFKI